MRMGWASNGLDRKRLSLTKGHSVGDYPQMHMVVMLWQGESRLHYIKAFAIASCPYSPNPPNTFSGVKSCKALS